MAEFRHIGIVSRPSRKTTAESIRRVARLVEKKGCELLVDEQTASVLEMPKGLELPELAERADLGVVVGGDGTLLRAVRHMAPRGVPVCGVNRGRLGFLADIYPEQIPSVLGSILDGKYETDQRSILVGEVLRGEEQLCISDALNDVVVHSYRDLHMIELQTLISGRPLSALRADGLIISTPTGSTAYALSGGGPILHPSLEVLVMVPICPHMLSSRPIVIDLDSEIELEVIGRPESRGVVSFDGSANQELTVGDRIRIRRQDYPLTLIQPEGHDYYEILRRKLSWNL